MANPHSSLALDPNNFIIPTGPLQSTDDIAKVHAVKSIASDKAKSSQVHKLLAYAFPALVGCSLRSRNTAPAHWMRRVTYTYDWPGA